MSVEYTIKNKESDEPLQCEVIGDRLIISMGVDRIQCFKESLKETGEWPKQAGCIINKKEFCKDLAKTLCHEDETGFTMLIECLERGIINTIYNGSAHINWIKK